MKRSFEARGSARLLLCGKYMLLGGVSAMSLAGVALAQDAGGGATAVDEIVVTGTRRTVQTSIETKRGSATIVDALTADEIGDLPALSVGEAIETISESNSITSWASFDAVCLFEAYAGVEDTGLPLDIRAVENRDVAEDVLAAYGMASFETALGGLPVRGNVGVRVVDTQVTSKGLRADLDVVNNPDGTIRLVPTGEFDEVVIEAGTTRWLPSLNLTFELKEDLLLRAGVFRAMSRPAPSALGAGRVITVDSGADYASIEDAVRNITANGSPRLEPLMSWNADLSLEYYANKDSLYSLALYTTRSASSICRPSTNTGRTITRTSWVETRSCAMSTAWARQTFAPVTPSTGTPGFRSRR